MIFTIISFSVGSFILGGLLGFLLRSFLRTKRSQRKIGYLDAYTMEQLKAKKELAAQDVRYYRGRKYYKSEYQGALRTFIQLSREFERRQNLEEDKKQVAEISAQSERARQMAEFDSVYSLVLNDVMERMKQSYSTDQDMETIRR